MSRFRSLAFLRILGMGIFAANPVFARKQPTYKRVAKIHIPHLMSTTLAAFLGMASLLALGGCTSVKVKLGMKVYLAKTPIASIQASLPKGPAIAPGEKSPLVVVVTGPDGKVLQTEGQGKGKVDRKSVG